MPVGLNDAGKHFDVREADRVPRSPSSDQKAEHRHERYKHKGEQKQRRRKCHSRRPVRVKPALRQVSCDAPTSPLLGKATRNENNRRGTIGTLTHCIALAAPTPDLHRRLASSPNFTVGDMHHFVWQEGEYSLLANQRVSI